MKPRFFATPGAFRAWLERHHTTAPELIVGFFRKSTGRPSITWPESVDQALCFGWIDGIRRRLDDAAYTIRFTPRRPGSTWSAINIARVAELTKLDLMRPAGLAAFARRVADNSRINSYEQRHHATLEPVHLERFQANRKAWAFFTAQAPSYRQTSVYWVTSAKLPATREQRLKKLIAESAAGRRV